MRRRCQASVQGRAAWRRRRRLGACCRNGARFVTCASALGRSAKCSVHAPLTACSKFFDGLVLAAPPRSSHLLPPLFCSPGFGASLFLAFFSPPAVLTLRP
jgi:hypothetical protein